MKLMKLFVLIGLLVLGYVIVVPCLLGRLVSKIGLAFDHVFGGITGCIIEAAESIEYDLRRS